MDYQPGSDPFDLPPDRPSDDVAVSVATQFRAPTKRRKRGRGPVMALIGFVVVLALVGGAGLFARSWLSSTSQTAAERIPSNVDIYVGIDLVRLQASDTEDLINAIARAVSGDGSATVDTAITELDQALNDELGVTFTDDISPWLGRTAAFGMKLPDDVTDPYSLNTIPDMVIAIEVRDDAKADDFLDVIAAHSPGDMTEQTSDHGRLWIAMNGEEEVWHGDGIILLGTTSMVERARILDPSMSLSAVADFQTLTAALPASRVMTSYMRPQAFESMVSLSTAADQPAAAAWSVEVTSSGLQFDIVSPSNSTMASLYGVDGQANAFLSRLDRDTVGMVQMGSASDLYDQFAAAFDAMMGTGIGMADVTPENAPTLDDEIEQAVGFDVVNDLIRKLDGPTGVAAIRHDDGWGFMGAFATSDPAGVEDALGRLAASAEAQGAPVDHSGAFYDLEGVKVGTSGYWMVIGTDEADLQALGAGSSSPLTDSQKFQQATAGLEKGQTVIAYVDIRSLVDEFATDPDVHRSLSPFVSLVVGAEDDGGLFRGTTILVIDTDPAAVSEGPLAAGPTN